MDDMTAFEHELSAGFRRLMGPVRPVDDGAVLAAISAAGSSGSRSRSFFSVASLVTAGAVVALFGGSLLVARPDAPQGRGAPGAAQDTSTAASPSPSSGPVPAEPAASGLFRPGTYMSRFWPSLKMTAPDFWTIESGSDGFVGLQPVRPKSLVFLNVVRDLSVASGDCEEAAESGVGDSASDMIGSLAQRPGLATSEPVPVEVGGLSGLQLDLAIAEDWTATCPQIGSPFVPLVYASDLLWFGAEPDERWRIIVLDVAPLPSGMNATVSLVFYAADPTAWEDHLAAAMTMVDSFEFTVSGSPAPGGG